MVGFMATNSLSGKAKEPASANGAPPLGVQRKTISVQVADAIRQRILTGEYAANTQLKQEHIAVEFGVSRIPVREALLSLEREGWVTIRPHRGAFIGSLDEAAVRDHYALYGLVYGFAAQRATERSTPELVSRLGAVCDRLDGEDDPAAVARLNREFDGLIMKTASSPRLRAVLRAMVGIVPGNFFALVPGAVEVERAGSRTVLQAIAAGDGGAAAEAYATMLQRQGDLVADLFKSRGLFTARDEAGPGGR